jgi:hypothetical protein
MHHSIIFSLEKYLGDKKMCERARGRELVRSSDPRFHHHGPPRRYSPSSEARYYRVGRGPSTVPPNGGDRGEWTVVRSRRRKASEQVSRRQDRFWEEQRHGGSRGRRHGQSRVRDWYDDHYDSEEDWERGNQVLSNDGRVTINFERQPRVRARDCLSYGDVHVLQRRSPSINCERPTSKHPVARREQLEQQGRRPVSRQREQKGRRSVSRHQAVANREQLKSVNSTFVSFYFTNVPHDISYSALWQGFEVCGVWRMCIWLVNVMLTAAFLVLYVMVM